MDEQHQAIKRDIDIITFYYAIFGNRIRSGMSRYGALSEAYDAVLLRYGIGKRRLQNIISQRKISQRGKDEAFIENAILIAHLDVVNEELHESIRKNEKLISLLKECAEDDR